MTDTTFPEVLHLAAFADGPGGGNMAGVVLEASGLSDQQMLRTARELGYSETAFVTTALDANRGARIRYFSPRRRGPLLRPRDGGNGSGPCRKVWSRRILP